MKSVLVLASGFPPQGGGGVTRVHAFVKYLPQFGWQPIVLTLGEQYAYSHAIDPALLDEYDQCVEIHRTKSLEPTRFFGMDFRHQMAGSSHKSLYQSSLIHNAASVLHHRLLIPDEKILWLPFCLNRAVRLVRERHIEIVFVTTPPHSVGLVAYFLKKATGIRYVWDIRDDWVGNPYFASASWLRHHAESFLESLVMRNADRIVVTSEASGEFLGQKYPDLRAQVHMIPNGFDPTSYPSDASDGKAVNPKCRLVYSGSLTRRRQVPVFWHALAELRDSGLVNASNLEIILVGSVHRTILDIIRNSQLEEIVSLTGHVSQRQSLRYLLEADVCLLISTEEEGARTAIPSKFYEYVGARKFILALTSINSATANLMRESSIGIVASPVDRSAVRQAIMHIMKLHENGNLNVRVNKDWITQFDRRHLTEKLAGIFEPNPASLEARGL